MSNYPSAVQSWLANIPVMQQSVLLCALRGHDGMFKEHPSKMLVRWLRRCILISAFDGKAILRPYEPGGGSFTGPCVIQYKDYHTGQPTGPFAAITANGQCQARDTWQEALDDIASGFIEARDEYTLHFWLHTMHAAQIIGCHHPDDEVAMWWRKVYIRMVNAMHLEPEPDHSLMRRLSDNPATWRERNDMSDNPGSVVA